MLRALWLVVAYDLLEYRYIDDVTGNLFPLFCSTYMARGFENVCEMTVFRIKASDWASTKTLQELFTKKRNGEKERKRALYNLGQLKNA